MNRLWVRVAEMKVLTPVIRELTLEPVEGALLPFSSGSHIVLELPLKDRVLRNAYSLLNDPNDTQHYQIAVRLQEQSRGGSAFVHEQIKVGDRLAISAPLNLFALHSKAQHHVFIAGGIGITPFLAHMKYLLHRGGSFELHYACREGISNAYQEMLLQLFGDRVHLYSNGKRLNVAAVLADRALHTHVYICGPETLIEAVQQQATALAWSPHRVHWEAFQAPPVGEAFSVQLRSGRQIDVPSDFSLLEALERAEVQVQSLCRGGVCGQCVVQYSAGEIEHHDHFLGDDERQHALMPCVSRGKAGQCLQLNLE